MDDDMSLVEMVPCKGMEGKSFGRKKARSRTATSAPQNVTFGSHAYRISHTNRSSVNNITHIMVSPTAAVGPSPSANEPSDGTYASYVPHDLKYSTDFEDSLVQALLDPEAKTDIGIRVIPDDSDEAPEEGVSIRARDILLPSLPNISEDELPLPLSDPRRVFASAIPGIKLTHPGGYLEGGPGLDPELDTFPDDFLNHNTDIGTAAALNTAIQSDIETHIETLKERLRARQKAKEKNEQIEKELRALVDQHNMELKIQRRMAEEQKAKRAAKEKKKREKAGC